MFRHFGPWIDVCSRPKQRVENLQVVIPPGSGLEQRAFALFVSGVDLGAGLNERGDDFRLGGSSGGEQRGFACVECTGLSARILVQSRRPHDVMVSF